MLHKSGGVSVAITPSSHRALKIIKQPGPILRHVIRSGAVGELSLLVLRKNIQTAASKRVADTQTGDHDRCFIPCPCQMNFTAARASSLGYLFCSNLAIKPLPFPRSSIKFHYPSPQPFSIPITHIRKMSAAAAAVAVPTKSAEPHANIKSHQHPVPPIRHTPVS